MDEGCGRRERRGDDGERRRVEGLEVRGRLDRIERTGGEK